MQKLAICVQCPASGSGTWSSGVSCAMSTYSRRSGRWHSEVGCRSNPTSGSIGVRTCTQARALVHRSYGSQFGWRFPMAAPIQGLECRASPAR